MIGVSIGLSSENYDSQIDVEHSIVSTASNIWQVSSNELSNKKFFLSQLTIVGLKSYRNRNNHEEQNIAMALA